MGPLSSIRILDFSRVLAGPFCSMNLADLGADVVKIESVDGGDETRTWGPPFAATESAYYLTVNRNKRSMAVDLKMPLSRTLITNLISEADVVLHNFMPSSVQKLGLSYEQVKAIRPDIVYCGISGYGQDTDVPGYDYVMQAIGGLMSITGASDGPPTKVGVAVVDLFTGLYATISILAALRHRERTGQGQAIDMALYDAQIAMLANVASNVLVSGKDAMRFGNEHPSIVPYQSFHTRDGQIVVAIGNDRQFQAFCAITGLSELGSDSRFVTNSERVRHRGALVELVQARLQQFSTDELLAHLNLARVPCGPVRTVKEALEAQETAHRNMVWPMQHPTGGELSLVASPLKLLQTPAVLYRNPPLYGEHTREILQALQMSDAAIEQLIEQGVVRSC